MTVSVTLNQLGGQTVMLDMMQEKPVQSLVLTVGSGTCNIARLGLTEIESELDEAGLVLDFVLNQYIIRS